MITWNIYQSSASSAVAAVLANGGYENGSATTTSIKFGNGAYSIFFDGVFTVSDLGVLAGGTITGFHVYGGAQLLGEAMGYALDIGDVIDGLFATDQALDLLLHIGPMTINGSTQDDIIAGGLHDYRIFGNGGDDAVAGAQGDDFISGGAGLDTLSGGIGIDTVDYSEKTADVRITLKDTGQSTVKVNGVAEDTIEQFENANGGSGDDVIAGNSLANRLVGNGGNDLLIGGEGGDTLVGGLGNDIYYANFGDAVIEAAGEGIDTVTTDASHTLAANVENLTLVGDGPLTGTGNVLANTIVGSDGNNVLNGGLGADAMKGGLGDDRYVVDNPKDVVTEAAGEGADTVNASVSFALGANLENLVLTGASAIDGTGNELANAISGNAGANALAGGLGLDVLSGGEGSDVFVFDTKLGKANADTIADFAAGFDHIGLDADIFKKVNDAGKLKSKFFADGKAHDGNDYIIFKEKSGALYYDKDGDGDRHQKLVAKLDAHLDAGDFLII